MTPNGRLAACMVAPLLVLSLGACVPVQQQRPGVWAPPAQPIYGRTCTRRMGPFVTQSTAFSRRNYSRRQGLRTSGVFSCGIRLYCYNVFVRC